MRRAPPPRRARREYTPIVQADPPLVVDELSVVSFACKSLERALAQENVPLLGAAEDAPPDAEEAARVRAVLDAGAAPEYWANAARDGQRDEDYRRSQLGATLVHFLCAPAAAEEEAAGGAAASSGAVRASIAQFRSRGENALPDTYTWFDDDALHVTVRGLFDGKPHGA